jgi:hypothetical protein
MLQIASGKFCYSAVDPLAMQIWTSSFPCPCTPQPYAPDSLVAFAPLPPFLIDPDFEPPIPGWKENGDKIDSSLRQCGSAITQRAHVAHGAGHGDRGMA